MGTRAATAASRAIAAIACALTFVACAPAPPPPPATTRAPVTSDCAAPGGSAPTEAVPAAPSGLEGDGLEGDGLEGDGLAATAHEAVEQARASSSERVSIVSWRDGAPEVHDVALEHVEAAVAMVDEVATIVDVEVPVLHHLVEHDPADRDPLDGDPLDRAVEQAAVAPSSTIDDPWFAHQWAFDALPFVRTWPCGRGAGVTVAVIDTGVQGNHPDLGARVLSGYTKLHQGPAVHAWGNLDPHGHGTHVAGTIAATAGNGAGVVGVAPDVTVLPVRVLDEAGLGWSSDIAAGIRWAVDRGASVLNLSLGSTTESSAVSEAVDYAHSRGVLVVAAAGNGGPTGAPQYPAALPGVVAVASITSDGSLSSFSTRGSYVSVAAPGSNVQSTCITSTYCSKSGTSMATPHVSGLAALVRSANPSISRVHLRDRIVTTATDAGPVGFDHGYGHGIIAPVAAVTGRPG